MQHKLIPCPFCKSTSVTIQLEYHVGCTDCYASGPSERLPALAADSWNAAGGKVEAQSPLLDTFFNNVQRAIRQHDR